jgi:ParB family transcriptional regulator, chromosome partitioning protein
VSSPRRLGLPDTLRMRHDNHYVDQLGRPGGVPVGRMVPIEDIEPNPNQPRQALGDISELIASINEKGILEPILVRPRGSRFQIIAGERRFRAASEAGLAEIPCVVRDTTDAEMMEIALVENLQRKDLTAFEEADGLKVLADNFGYTHEAMAQKLGKGRTSITEILTLTAMPDDVREQCRRADIHSKSLLLQIVRQSTPEKMAQMVGRLLREGGTREQARRIAKEAKPKAGRGRPRHYVFRYQPREKNFTLSLQFRKADVPREDVVRALQAIIDELMNERVSARARTSS